MEAVAQLPRVPFVTAPGMRSSSGWRQPRTNSSLATRSARRCLTSPTPLAPIFDRLDTDKNGKLDKTEFESLKKLLNR